MIRVLLEAPILTKSGYGEHARLVFQSLKNNSQIDLFINPLQWGTCSWEVPNEDIASCIHKYKAYNAHCVNTKQNPEYSMQIHVGIPSEFEKKAPYSICITAGIETDRVVPSWLIKTHQGIDKIIVPSEHAKSGFVNTGYEILNKKNNTKTSLNCACPVDVIPYPVKKPTGPALEIDFETEFNFLSIVMIGPRKNIETSIRCFVESFRDNSKVGLVIKASHSKSSIIDRNKTKKYLENFINSLGDKKCKIYLIHGNLSESEIHSLYTHPKIKAYYTTSHGEGYGLPIFEAAYSGLPVIATDWSGHLDFLTANVNGKDKKLFAKINFDLKEVQQSAVWPDIISEDSKWAFPKDLSIKEQLSKVYKNYGMYKKWANQLKENIENKFLLNNILEEYSVSIFGEEQDKEIDVNSLRKQALEISNPKERAKFAANILEKDLSQKEKIEFLKDLFKGEKAYVLSCGPTLTDHNSDKINNLLEKNLTVAIKQSFELFKENVDLHIYNCANFKEYDYSKQKPITIEASSTPYKLSECDLKFFIREREYENSVASLKNFDDWTFSKQPLLRPYGPGIMYEVVFYTLHHLGVSEAVTIGWDNKLIEGTAAQQHFYDKKDSSFDKKDFIDSNEVADNTTAVDNLQKEGSISTDAISPWYKWLVSNGTTLKIVSSINPAPGEIERVQI